jgi:Lon protease-like protein
MQALPGVTYRMNIFEPRYRLMLRRVLLGKREFGMCAPAPPPLGYDSYGTMLVIRDVMVRKGTERERERARE